MSARKHSRRTRSPPIAADWPPTPAAVPADEQRSSRSLRAGAHAVVGDQTMRPIVFSQQLTDVSCEATRDFVGTEHELH